MTIAILVVAALGILYLIGAAVVVFIFVVFGVLEEGVTHGPYAWPALGAVLSVAVAALLWPWVLYDYLSTRKRTEKRP